MASGGRGGYGPRHDKTHSLKRKWSVAWLNDGQITEDGGREISGLTQGLRVQARRVGAGHRRREIVVPERVLNKSLFIKKEGGTYVEKGLCRGPSLGVGDHLLLDGNLSPSPEIDCQLGERKGVMVQRQGGGLGA